MNKSQARTVESVRNAMHVFNQHKNPGHLSFAAAIGEAYFAADTQNRKRLLEAFGDLFERFHREV